jgi:hypothetical protein
MKDERRRQKEEKEKSTGDDDQNGFKKWKLPFAAAARGARKMKRGIRRAVPPS